MFGGSKTIVGIDVGSWSVKAVALQATKGRLSLMGFSHMRLDEQDPSLITRHVLDHMGVKARNVVSSVSGRSVIVRQVETPRLESSELRAHIAYEADKYIPFGADEVVLDCQALPANSEAEEKAPNQQVLLVAVRRGFVEDHIGMLQAAGVTPQVVDVDVFAMCNAYWTLGPKHDEEHPEQGATALVDIGATKSWVAIVKNRRPLFQREIYLAGNEITDSIVRAFNEQAEDIERIKLDPGSDETLDALIDAAMPAIEDLANEIRLSFDYVEGQFDEEVTKIVLSGGSSLMPNFPDVLGNILGRPVEIFDPCSGLDLIPSKYDLHSLDANAPALTVALGLACHLAADETVTGLGGGELASWNPRRGSGHSSRTQAPSADHPAEPTPVPGGDETMATFTAPPPSPNAAGPISFPTPPPGSIPAPPPYVGEPAVAPEIPPENHSMPELQPPTDLGAPDAFAFEPIGEQAEAIPAARDDDVAQPADESSRYSSQNNRSSMMVVLEDDDDDDIVDDSDDGLPSLPG